MTITEAFAELKLRLETCLTALAKVFVERFLPENILITRIWLFF